MMLMQILTTTFRPTRGVTTTPYPFKGEGDLSIIVDGKRFTDLYQAILHQIRTGAESLGIENDYKWFGQEFIALDDQRRRCFAAEFAIEENVIRRNHKGEIFNRQGEMMLTLRVGRQRAQVPLSRAGVTTLTQMLRQLNASRPKRKAVRPVAWAEGLEGKLAPRGGSVDSKPLAALPYVQSVMVSPKTIKLVLLERYVVIPPNYTGGRSYEVEVLAAEAKRLYASSGLRHTVEGNCLIFPLSEYEALLKYSRQFIMMLTLDLYDKIDAEYAAKGFEPIKWLQTDIPHGVAGVLIRAGLLECLMLTPVSHNYCFTPKTPFMETFLAGLKANDIYHEVRGQWYCFSPDHYFAVEKLMREHYLAYVAWQVEADEQMARYYDDAMNDDEFDN